MIADAGEARPRLLFFQWDHGGNAEGSRFLVQHMADHVACLRESFDVTVVARDCDFAEACDRCEPDLVLFESGYRTHGSRRIEVRNVGANPRVPRLGLHNGDPWCDRRAGFLSDMDQWGIETFFTISTRLAEYTPSIADRLFVWPNFINPGTFHDHGLEKTVPVMLTGQAGSLYPWRQAVYPLLASHFACLTTPTFQYESRSAGRMLSGQAYARALGASRVAPTCGTMGSEFVRKHLEIPGAGCCLVTQRTPALEAAGFRDMESCVFAEADDVVDRIDALLADEDRLRAITDAGHALVHARHTLRHRPQILQWYLAQRDLRPGERIVQEHPFADLAREPASGGKVAWSGGPALDRRILEQGRAQRAMGQAQAARDSFERCLALVGYLPEAHLELARSDLERGDAAAARRRLATLISTTVSDYGALDPDPAELALYVVALLASGEVAQARHVVERYPRVSHPLLGHAAGALARLDPTFRPVGAAGVVGPAARASLHPLAEMSAEEWTSWLARVLALCGQADLARRLESRAPPLRTTDPTRAPVGQAAHALRFRLYRGLDAMLPRLGASELRPGVPPLPGFGYGRLLARRILRSVLPERLRRGLRCLQASVTDARQGAPAAAQARLPQRAGHP